MHFVIPFSVVVLATVILIFFIQKKMPFSEVTLSKKKIMFFTSLALPMGGLLFFGANTLVPKTGLARVNKDYAIQAKFGEDLSKEKAEEFTTQFSYALKDWTDARNNNALFKTFYTGGVWYTAEELGNFIDRVLTQNPSLPADKVRFYFCPSVYSNTTKHPQTGKDLGSRISTCLVAMKPPYNLLKPPFYDELNIVKNSSYLGSYNWGGLEPQN